MAKKKGSMSLKDFHGGEIRSDLPLPSKPGVGTDSASKAFGLERPYSDSNRDRFAPAYGRSASNRHTPPPDSSYFPDASSIGKNYEEDERKPVGGGGARRPELGAFAGGAYPSHLVTERFPPSGGGYTSRLANLPNDTPPLQNSPPAAERPKLQLQARSRPLDDDVVDLSISPGAQVLTIQRKESDPLEGERPKMNLHTQSREEESVEQKGSYEGEEDGRPKERPKLNLKPRSQDAVVAPETEQSKPGVFGGARPRDVVLKERGVDEAVIVGFGDTRATDSPKKEAAGAPVASPDQQKWGRDDPREDRYVKADPQWRNGPKDSPSQRGWGEKPNSGAFRANGRPDAGFERQGSGGFTRLGGFGDNRGGFGDNRGGFGGNQWRQPKPASPPVRSALIDTSAKRDSWEGPLTSVQLAEAFSRSASVGSPGQGRGSWGPPNGFGGTPPGRGSFNRGPGGMGRSASFGRPGSYGRSEMGYNPSGPRSQVYQDDERGELVLPGKRPQRDERY